MLDFLKGKKTYIVGAVMVVVAGLAAQGYISQTTLTTLESVLTGLGLWTLRAGIAAKP